MYGDAQDMLTALLPEEDQRNELLAALREADIDFKDLAAAWAFTLTWIEQHQDEETAQNG